MTLEQRFYSKDVRAHGSTYCVRSDWKEKRGNSIGFGVSSVNSGRRLQHEQQIKNRMYIGGGLRAVNERAADKETEPPCDTSVQQEAPMVTFAKGSIPLSILSKISGHTVKALSEFSIEP